MEKNIRGREREEGRKRAAASKKRRRRALIAVLVSLLTILIIVFSMIMALLFFKVETITVKGTVSIYSQDEIIAATSVAKQDNLLFLNKKKIEQSLVEKLPYIKTVKLEKKLPSTVIVNVTQTKNELCILSDGKYYAADKDGKILAKLEAADESLPLFILPKECDITVGKEIRIEDTVLYDLFYKCIDLTKQYSFRINEVDISNTYDLYLLVDNRLKVKVGSPNNFDLKLAHFNTMLPSVPTGAKGTVDLSSWTPENKKVFFAASEF